MAEYIEREATCKGCVRYGMGEPFCDECVVKVAPAADVAPVAHGRWEVYMDGKYLMCSACKASFWDKNGDGGTNYCPNCGARMDGE